MKARLAQLAGSGLGLGYLPVAPGTWGSAGGLLIWWLTLPMGRGLQALLLILAIVPAALACGTCAREVGRDDPSFVVLDEVLGMYLALLFLSPLTTIGSGGFRVVPTARYLQALAGECDGKAICRRCGHPAR